MTPAERELVELLEDVTPAPSGYGWTARCPGCSSPGALRVRPTSSGSGYLEIDCDAGCEFGAVLDAIDVRRQP